MNKKLLTAAILAATAGAAHAQSSVTLYGLIDAGISFANHSKTATGNDRLFKYDDGVAQGSRWGLRGTEDLGGGLKAIFVLENGFNSGTGALGQGGAIFGRQAYVGLSTAQYGTVTFGRQYSFSTDVLGANYSTGGNTVAGNYAYHVNDVDQLTSSRINNAVKFQSANYAGFTFGALYGFSNSTDFAGAPATTSGTTTTPGSSRAYSFGLNYANGPFSLGAAYTDIRYPSQSIAPNGSSNFNLSLANISTGTVRDLRTYGVGGRYIWGPATAWLLWTRTQFSTVSGVGGSFYNAYEAGVKYALTPALSAAAGYTYTNATQNGGSAHWNQGDLALDYALSKRTDVYGLVVYQQASGNTGTTNVAAQIGSSTSYFNTSGNAQNQLAVRVGIRHKF
ncbi:porin [Burkholderia ubonensis]|uniref:Porin n=1 Tax=Burkholderia ubonensis TaxID=101571 RepID=A0A119YH29_9BURK|nr:porin [Burkholderia ubonensis]AOK27460.1 porin [Burkholderia ubonensis]KVH73329.1 porin [Burkholderia ubonensis]KVL13184.1 porin [Burkholderia ubonensis]KVM18426.1 porin [Burkholderia ubonensis]KVM21903.1 porin [Burkholderia ubonensis]